MLNKELDHFVMTLDRKEGMEEREGRGRHRGRERKEGR